MHTVEQTRLRIQPGSRILIISCNPDNSCISAERHLIRALRDKSTISAINLNRTVGQYHPEQKLMDVIYERIDRKYDRFILPCLNDEDLSREFHNNIIKVAPQMPATIEQIRKYRVDGISIGLATLSTAASFSRSSSNDKSNYKKYLPAAWRIAHISHAIGLQIAKKSLDYFIIFNGRHAISRPVSEVLLSFGVSPLYYEFLDERRERVVIFDDFIHTFNSIAAAVRQTPATEAGNKFYQDSITRKPGTISLQVTGEQRKGSLPHGLEPEKEVVCYFTSSSDEFFAVADDNNFIEGHSNQGAAAIELATICNELGLQLVVRLHPHLKTKHSSWRDEWDFEELQRLGALIVFPEEEVDSYALLFRSKAVVSTLSTMGIEAAYFGKPSVSIADSLGCRINCVVECGTRKELKSFLNNPYCLLNARSSAIRYGEFVTNPPGGLIAGFQVNEIFNATVDGDFISPSRYICTRLKVLGAGLLRSPRKSRL